MNPSGNLFEVQLLLHDHRKEIWMKEHISQNASNSELQTFNSSLCNIIFSPLTCVRVIPDLSKRLAAAAAGEMAWASSSEMYDGAFFFITSSNSFARTSSVSSSLILPSGTHIHRLSITSSPSLIIWWDSWHGNSFTNGNRNLHS